MKKRKMFIRMITASLMRRKSRMLIALLAVAIGATILSGLITIYLEVPRQMGEQFRNYGANMIFTATEEDFTQADMDEGLSVIDEDYLVGATPYRYETIRMHEQPILAAGTDMEMIQKTSPYWMIEGEWFANEGELLVGATVAEELSLSVGDTVTASFTPEDEEELDTTIDFTVVGIISTGGSEEEYVYMSMADIETLTGETDSIDLAEVSVSATEDELTAYTEEIESTNSALEASLVKRVTASETTVLSKLQGLILIVTIIVLALTMICVATTMTAVVSERRSEIGLRKAIGASDRSIIWEFMGEAMLLGAVGGVIGAFVGFAFAQAISVNVFSSYISIRIPIILLTIVVSIAITAVACLIPIRSSTRIEPALVLKGE